MVSVTNELTILASRRGQPCACAGSERFVLSEWRCPTARPWNRHHRRDPFAALSATCSTDDQRRPQALEDRPSSAAKVALLVSLRLSTGAISSRLLASLSLLSISHCL